MFEKQSVDPLVAFAFLRTFVDILKEYFGTVNAATIKDNFDVVYQVSLPVFSVAASLTSC